MFRISMTLALVLLFGSLSSAYNEVLFLHDSPAPPTGDQIWNDQWTGGSNPLGEYMDAATPFHFTVPPPWATVTIPFGNYLYCHDEPAHHYNDGDYDAYLWLKKSTASAPYETIVVSVWDETLSGPLVNLIAGPTSVQITDYINWQEYRFYPPFVTSQVQPRIVLKISMLEHENAELSWDNIIHNSRLETPGTTGVENSTLGAIKAAFR